jgi:hypothetical protein
VPAGTSGQEQPASEPKRPFETLPSLPPVRDREWQNKPASSTVFRSTKPGATDANVAVQLPFAPAHTLAAAEAISQTSEAATSPHTMTPGQLIKTVVTTIDSMLQAIDGVTKSIASIFEAINRILAGLGRGLSGVFASPSQTSIQVRGLGLGRLAPFAPLHAVPGLTPRESADTLTGEPETFTYGSTESASRPTPSWTEQFAEAINNPSPKPFTLPVITVSPASAPGSSGATSGGSVTSGGSSSSGAALLANFALPPPVSWQPLQQQSVSIPNGIVLDNPVPPG